MSQKERLKRSLNSVRQLTEGILGSFKTPEQWVHQVHPRANHPLWIVGHLGGADDSFLALVDRSRCRIPDGWTDKFGVGSQPVADPAAYPPVAEVLEYFRERRATLLDVLQGLSDQRLSEPTPPETPDFLPDIAGVFEAVSWHEAMHAGQLTIAHRALGYPPVLGR